MRTIALFLSFALAGFSATPALAQCRCAAPADGATPQNQVFWDARSGRHLFFASRQQTWFYWQPEQRQWIAVALTPQEPAPVAPVAQMPLTVAPAPSAQHQHLAGGQPTNPRQPASAQQPYGGQRTCPVMDEQLGAHGSPIPVTVRGQTIFVCCQGCVRRVQADPDRFLAKVAQERARSGVAAGGQ